VLWLVKGFSASGLPDVYVEAKAPSVLPNVQALLRPRLPPNQQ
jgi:hypothetical protein